jgi:hypothetical protein
MGLCIPQESARYMVCPWSRSASRECDVPAKFQRKLLDSQQKIDGSDYHDGSITDTGTSRSLLFFREKSFCESTMLVMTIMSSALPHPRYHNCTVSSSLLSIMIVNVASLVMHVMARSSRRYRLFRISPSTAQHVTLRCCGAVGIPLEVNNYQAWDSLPAVSWTWHCL